MRFSKHILANFIRGRLRIQEHGNVVFAVFQENIIKCNGDESRSAEMKRMADYQMQMLLFSRFINRGIESANTVIKTVCPLSKFDDNLRKSTFNVADKLEIIG
jgi:hypothetical protein